MVQELSKSSQNLSLLFLLTIPLTNTEDLILFWHQLLRGLMQVVLRMAKKIESDLGLIDLFSDGIEENIPVGRWGMNSYRKSTA